MSVKLQGGARENVIYHGYTQWDEVAHSDKFLRVKQIKFKLIVVLIAVMHFYNKIKNKIYIKKIKINLLMIKTNFYTIIYWIKYKILMNNSKYIDKLYKKFYLN